MKVVFLKKNDFKEYKLYNLNGYLFYPRTRNIKSLNIVDTNFINCILSRKVNREIIKAKRAIKLIVNSNVTILSDCDMMLNELRKISKKLEKKYRRYFDKFQYFDRVKDLYILNNIINYKKKVLVNEEVS